MDDRVTKQAEVLVDWSARIETGDAVIVRVGENAHELAVAVAEALGERNANCLTLYDSGEVDRAYLKAHDGEFEADPDYVRELYRRADSTLRLGGTRNTFADADVPPARRQARARARTGIRDARMATDWVSTVHPTRALAQQAGMAYEEYREFVYDAVLRDWEALADEMAVMKDRLDAGASVRLVGPDTEITMSIEDRSAVNSCASVAYGSHNLPSGEVFTAPSATEGTVLFDVPMTISGTRVRDVRLTFEDGGVVDYAADRGEAAIAEVLETDAGAERLGELGIGMNFGIDRVTDNILFDEKMGGTVHLALGRAYDANVPEGESGNESAVHADLITDLRDAGRLEVDGEVVLDAGEFDR
jgi:aminopeptidase